MDNVQTASTIFYGGLAHDWTSVLLFLPNFFAFLLILVAGYFLSVALGKAVDKVLFKLGFDRAVERSGIKKALEGSGFHPSQVLGKIAFYTVFLFLLQLAFGVSGPNPISNLLTRVITFLPNVFVAIVIAVISASIAAAIRDVVKATLGGLSYGRILANLAGGAIILVGVFAALHQRNLAPEIVNGLLYATLAIIVGVNVVAFGGAGIQPLRSPWERAFDVLGQEIPNAKAQIENLPSEAQVAAVLKRSAL